MFIEKIGAAGDTRIYMTQGGDIRHVSHYTLLKKGDVQFINGPGGTWSEKHQAYIRTAKVKHTVDTITRRA
jgi:hypothetical protein